MFTFLYESEFLAPKYDCDEDLRNCVFDENYDGCLKALKCGGNPNAENEDGNSSIHVSACYGRSKIMRLLLESGANVNAKGRDGQTPLHFAARNNRPICVDTLLENGADVNHVDLKGRTALMCAAFNGSTETIVPLILGGAKIDQQSEGEGMTALHFAAMKGRRLVLNILLDQGADASLKNRSGETASNIAHASVRSVFEDKKIMSLRGSPRTSIVASAATSGVLLKTSPTTIVEKKKAESFKQGDKAIYIKTGQTITIIKVHTDDAQGPYVYCVSYHFFLYALKHKPNNKHRYYTVQFDDSGKVKQTVLSRMRALL